MEIEELVVKELYKKGCHISFGESMTGGLLASTIINVSGASNVIEKSYITYSNSAKTEILDVNPSIIQAYTVVSVEVTDAMVKGLFKNTLSEVCATVSGYADGYKPGIGKVCYSILYKNNILHNCVIIKGTRNEVRKKTVSIVLKEIYELIKEK